MKGPLLQFFLGWWPSQSVWLTFPPGRERVLDAKSVLRARDCRDGNALVARSGRPRRFRKVRGKFQQPFSHREEFDYNRRR